MGWARIEDSDLPDGFDYYEDEDYDGDDRPSSNNSDSSPESTSGTSKTVNDFNAITSAIEKLGVATEKLSNDNSILNESFEILKDTLSSLRDITKELKVDLSNLTIKTYNFKNGGSVVGGSSGANSGTSIVSSDKSSNGNESTSNLMNIYINKMFGNKLPIKALEKVLGGKALGAITKLGIVATSVGIVANTLEKLADCGDKANTKLSGLNTSILKLGDNSDSINRQFTNSMKIKSRAETAQSEMSLAFNSMFSGIADDVNDAKIVVKDALTNIFESIGEDVDNIIKNSIFNKMMGEYVVNTSNFVGSTAGDSANTISNLVGQFSALGYDLVSSQNLAMGVYDEAKKMYADGRLSSAEDVNNFALGLGSDIIGGGSKTSSFGVNVGNNVMAGYLSGQGIDIVNQQVTDAQMAYYRYQLASKELADKNSFAMSKQINDWEQLGDTINTAKNQLFDFDKVQTLNAKSFDIPTVGAGTNEYGDIELAVLNNKKLNSTLDNQIKLVDEAVELLSEYFGISEEDAGKIIEMWNNSDASLSQYVEDLGLADKFDEISTLLVLWDAEYVLDSIHDLWETGNLVNGSIWEATVMLSPTEMFNSVYSKLTSLGFTQSSIDNIEKRINITISSNNAGGLSDIERAASYLANIENLDNVKIQSTLTSLLDGYDETSVKKLSDYNTELERYYNIVTKLSELDLGDTNTSDAVKEATEKDKNLKDFMLELGFSSGITDKLLSGKYRFSNNDSTTPIGSFVDDIGKILGASSYTSEFYKDGQLIGSSKDFQEIEKNVKYLYVWSLAKSHGEDPMDKDYLSNKSIGDDEILDYVNAVKLYDEEAEYDGKVILELVKLLEDMGFKKTLAGVDLPDFSHMYEEFGVGHANGGISTLAHIANISENNRAEAIIPLESNDGIEALANAMRTASNDDSISGGDKVTVNINMKGISTLNKADIAEFGNLLENYLDNKNMKRGLSTYGSK